MMDFTVPADHCVKIKQSEKIGRYLDFDRELNKLWNMKVTVTPTVVGALTMGLERRMEKAEISVRIESIKFHITW